MAKNPVFPLYYNDIDRSTRDWTDEEFGCYVRLLMHQWAQGSIPKESQRLARIITSYEANWKLVGSKFVESGFGLVNERLEEIRAEQELFKKKQSENGKKGGRKPKLNPNDNPNTNPNESLHNEVEIEDDVLKGGTGEKTKDPQCFPTLETVCELSELEKTLTAELLRRTKKGDWSNPDLSEMFEGFKIQNFTGQKYYQDHGAIVSHFRNWMKIQKPHLNGKSNEPGSNSRAKIEAYKNW